MCKEYKWCFEINLFDAFNKMFKIFGNFAWQSVPIMYSEPSMKMKYSQCLFYSRRKRMKVYILNSL